MAISNCINTFRYVQELCSALTVSRILSYSPDERTFNAPQSKLEIAKTVARFGNMGKSNFRMFDEQCQVIRKDGPQGK